MIRVTLICVCLAVASIEGAFPNSILIRGARVHTVTDKGTLERTDVLVRDGRIVSVGSGLAVPADAQIFEAQNRPLTPGLFGGLSQLGLVEVSIETSTDDAGFSPGAPSWQPQWRPEFDVMPAYNPHSTLVPITRIEGFTWTVLRPYSDSFIAGQGCAVTLDGSVDALLAGSRSLFINLGGGGKSEGRAAQYMLLEQAIDEVHASVPPDDRSLLYAAGRQALKPYLAGGRVVIAVDRAVDISRAIAFARRHGMKPVIAGGTEAWRVANELAREKVPVILDPLANLPMTFDMLGARLDNAALLHAAGVAVVFSTGESHNARRLRQIAGNAVAHGLPWDVALAALTATPAQVFGLSSTRGHIAAGEVADLVLWSGDPLEVDTAAEQVWIAGRALDMRSRQTLLRDRYAERLEAR